jgi:D-alanyl-D-alanine carboxypeptidase
MRTLLTWLIALAWSQALSAQVASPPAAPTGDAAALTPETAYRLQATLDSARTRLGARGAAAALVTVDGRVWTGASGEAARGVPLTPETPFEIGSVTKTYTAAVLLRLTERGLLELDRPVSAWVPGAPRGDSVTLRQLLSHTAGVPDHMQAPATIPMLIGDPARRWAPHELLDIAAGEPAFAPGAGWAYSSTGFVVAGLAAEAAAGRPFHELLREVLDELGLEGTFLAPQEGVPESRAHAFLDVNGDGTPEDLSALLPPDAFLTAAWVAGALVAPAIEVARWTHALHTGGVLSAASYDEMTRLVERPDGRRYGLGLLVEERADGSRRLGHKGNSTGYSAVTWHVPAAGVTVAVLTNAHAVDVAPAAEALLTALSAGPR